MFGKRVDKTKPVEAPPGYFWRVERSPLSGAACVLKLCRDRGNMNSARGTLLPYSLGVSVFFNSPNAIRRASKKALAQLEKNGREEAMIEQVKEAVNDHP